MWQRTWDCVTCVLTYSFELPFFQRFLRYRPWLAFAMSPRKHYAEAPSQYSEERAEQAFQDLNQLPPVHDVMIPRFTLAAHELMLLGASDYRHGIVTAPSVAHAYCLVPSATVYGHPEGSSDGIPFTMNESRAG